MVMQNGQYVDDNDVADDELYEDQNGNVFDAAGNPVDLEDDEEIDISQLDPSQLTEDDWEELMAPVIVEAMIDGRLPCPDDQYEDALQAGFELGIVVETNNGLALARDVDFANGLALANEQQLELMQSPGYYGRAAKFIGRRAVHRVKTGLAQAGQVTKSFLTGASKHIGAAASGAKGVGAEVAGRAFHLGNKHKVALGAGAVGFGAGRMSGRKNPLHADAEKRAASMKK